MITVYPADAHRLITATAGLQVWDTRTHILFRQSHLPSAMSRPHSVVAASIEGCGCFNRIVIPKATPILVYGVGDTCAVLERNGYNTVYWLAGGLGAWAAARLPYLEAYIVGYRMVNKHECDNRHGNR